MTLATRLACPLAAFWLALAAPPPAVGAANQEEPELTAVRTGPHDVLREPDDPGWQRVPAVTVPLFQQMVVPPMQVAQPVEALSIKTAHDGYRIAFRLEWTDSTRNVTTRSDEFGDQVAVQLPLRHDPELPPSPMMGHAGAPVRILQWRSVLQEELTGGAPAIEDLYPHAIMDVYPDLLLVGEAAAPYAGGRSAGNPVSRPRLLTPVVAHVAEGFGTLTVAPDQSANGTGVWRDGRWAVVITHPFEPRADVPHALRPGIETIVAFAVWDGENHDVGARKAWSVWTPLRIQP